MTFGSIVYQIYPAFMAQRALYEAREQPSKAYSWVAFVITQILVELPWMVAIATLAFFTW